MIMFSRCLRSLSRSQSLTRSRRSRAAIFLINLLIVSGNATAEPQKNLGQFEIDEVVKNII
jgi:hypothetical protein